jgi:hypothetical protein
VEAHAQPEPGTGTREPIYYIEHHHKVMHHAILDDQPYIDDALVDTLQTKGLISIDYGGSHTLRLTPTDLGRETVRRIDRSTAPSTTAIEPLVAAFGDQALSSNPMAWPSIRPVLEALRDYWHACGYPPDGVVLSVIANEMSEGIGPFSPRP